MEKPLLKMSLNSKLLLMAVALLTMMSCSENTLFQESQELKENKWPIDSTYSFNVDVTDSVTPYNIELMVRHTGRYAFQNIWLFVESESPTHQVTRDTVEMYLADEMGRWMGSGLGSLYQLNYRLKQNYRFGNTGTYRFTIGQGMRYNPLEEVSDIGIKIERSTK